MIDHVRCSEVLQLLFPGSLDYVPQDALERGTRLHRALEGYCNNIIYGVAQGEILPEILPVTKWIQAQGGVPLAVEKRIYSPLGYHGCPDLVCLSRKGRKWVVDWKMAEAISEQNQMQMEAYIHLVGSEGGTLVQCNREGKVNARNFKRRPDLWAAFLSGVNVLRFIERNA